MHAYTGGGLIALLVETIIMTVTTAQTVYVSQLNAA